MKNIIAYSMEKLYKDLEEADELFLSSGMKVYCISFYIDRCVQFSGRASSESCSSRSSLRRLQERLQQSTWQPFTATWIVCCVRIFPELKNIPSRGMMNASC